jgi:hypothetical protein
MVYFTLGSRRATTPNTQMFAAVSKRLNVSTLSIIELEHEGVILGNEL